MAAYLFVHFREKTTPDGEQIYFALSRDGFEWTAVNHGQPVLWAYYGDKGVRDHTIVRDHRTGTFHILSTDLSLAYGLRNQYKGSWANIAKHGSLYLSHWSSEDLCTWTEQTLLPIGGDNPGCRWAPDIIWDSNQQAYLIHYSSPRHADLTGPKMIWGVHTSDWQHFSDPFLVYEEPGASVIDSAIYEEEGVYYLFSKSDRHTPQITLHQAPTPCGPWTLHSGFDTVMKDQLNGHYEAPTGMHLPDGRFLLFLDHFAIAGEQQGYEAWVASSLAEGDFGQIETCHFPYGFKHGTILTITDEEADRISQHNYNTYDYTHY